MSMSGSSMGGRTAMRAFEFGKTHVVKPKGKHQATIVWLHGLGDNGSSWSQLLETLPLPNIKWICPTAPSRPVTLFGGFPSTAWCDVIELSENAKDDLEGLDASAAHVASLLSTEPADIKLGIGGFSMGAGTSLYSATCYTQGKFGNGNPYTINLSAVVGLSGWLPCSKNLRKQVEGDEAARRAASLPILLCHGRGKGFYKCKLCKEKSTIEWSPLYDPLVINPCFCPNCDGNKFKSVSSVWGIAMFRADEVVRFKFGEMSSQQLRSCGFQDCTFKAYNALGHYTIPEEMDDLCAWLTSKLGLEG